MEGVSERLRGSVYLKARNPKKGILNEEEVKEVVLKVADMTKAEAAAVFGSYAAGTASEKSDVDILLVNPETDRIEIDPPKDLDIYILSPEQRWGIHALIATAKAGKIIKDSGILQKLLKRVKSVKEVKENKKPYKLVAEVEREPLF